MGLIGLRPSRWRWSGLRWNQFRRVELRWADWRSSVFVFAPTGRDSIAQANGLGTRNHNRIVSPNGARFDNHVGRVMSPFNESRPVGAWVVECCMNDVTPRSQGVALGYRMPPRWGQCGCDFAIKLFCGLGRAYELFGDKLNAILDELNMRLAA